MGWESEVTAASSLLTVASKFSNANAVGDAAQTEARYKENNITNQTLRKVGSLQTSYLQSGIALDPDTAVNTVMQQAIAQGVTDINRTQDNANTESKNAVTAARASALSTLGASALKTFNPNGSGGANEQLAYGLNAAGFGNTAYDMLDPTPGP